MGPLCVDYFLQIIMFNSTQGTVLPKLSQRFF